MRRLTYLILTLAAIYAGYWFIGADRVTNGAETALAAVSCPQLSAQ